MNKKEYVRKVNRSYSKTFSRNQFLPKILHKYLSIQDTVLDFGAGKGAFGTMHLRKQGFNVVATDIGSNFNPLVHDAYAMRRKYTAVFASNVINVQPSRSDVIKVVDQIKGRLHNGGLFFFNYPDSPRYNDYTIADLELLMKKKFSQIKRISGSPAAWMCVK